MTEHELTRASVEGGQTLQRMQTPYATAVSVQRPRQLKDVYRRLNDEARIGGESFYYGWGAGKDQIEGPSIQLATAAARSWGNCAVEMEDVQDLGDSWIFTAIFVDVETGFTLKRQFRQSKTSIVYGKHDEHRKADIRFQIGQSKATRNVVLNALPKSMIREAMDTAKAGVRERLEAWISKQGENGIVKAQDAALEQLKRLGVTEEQVLAKLNRAGRGAITIDDLVVLKGDIVAVNDGAERVEELYPAAADEDGEGASLMDHLGGGEPFPTANGERNPRDSSEPAPGGSKPDATAGTDPPPPPTTNADVPDGQYAEVEKTQEVTAEEVEAILEGSFGPVSAEAVTELRARFGRLDEDPDALAKYDVDYGAMAEVDGELAVSAVTRIEQWYARAADEYLAGKEGK